MILPRSSRLVPFVATNLIAVKSYIGHSVSNLAAFREVLKWMNLLYLSGAEQ